MPKLTYQAKKPDVPEGTHVCRFVGTEEREPFDGPSKFKNSRPGPRLEWIFDVTEGPAAGKRLTWTTGAAIAGPKSSAFKMAKWLMGRAPADGEDVDTDAYVGRAYRVKWEVNPESESGNFHIAYMEEVKSAPGSPAAAAAQQTAAASYWMDFNGAVQEAPAPEVQKLVDAGCDPQAMMLMSLDQSSGWRPAVFFGFKRKAAPPAPPPPAAKKAPPPPPTPPQPAAPPQRTFHVEGAAEPMTEAEVQDLIIGRGAQPQDVRVCLEGGEEWKPASEFGFTDRIPF